jgi:hypothetical protein
LEDSGELTQHASAHLVELGSDFQFQPKTPHYMAESLKYGARQMKVRSSF